VQFEHSFTLPVGVAEAWRMLLDSERVAGSLPGADLAPVGDGGLAGTVTLAIGPIGIPYQVKVALVDREDGARTAVIEADGREVGGTGTAVVTTIVILTAEGVETTRGDVVTDLTVTGRLAQFGQTMLGGVEPLVSADAQLADRVAAAARPTPAALVPAAAVEPAPAALVPTPAAPAVVLPAAAVEPAPPVVLPAAAVEPPAAAAEPPAGPTPKRPAKRPAPTDVAAATVPGDAGAGPDALLEPANLPWPQLPGKPMTAEVPLPARTAPASERLRPAFALGALLLLVVGLLRRRRG
jgi:uncharacterized protein